MTKGNCYSCNSSLDYSEKWDSYYCINCNVWTEIPCNDPLCQFCSERSDRPLNNQKDLVSL